MHQPWTCEECGASNKVIVSLLAPPPDSIVRICPACEHTQEIRIPERDAALPARQTQTKIEGFRRKSSPAIASFRP